MIFLDNTKRGDKPPGFSYALTRILDSSQRDKPRFCLSVRIFFQPYLLYKKYTTINCYSSIKQQISIEIN
ncbi:hypothetical protein HMPREF1361_01628 [Enterococcus faecium ERV1]|nr:hypothetical protein HMPREF1361_01628 [Enterococcus faecium ERV1]